MDIYYSYSNPGFVVHINHWAVIAHFLDKFFKIEVFWLVINIF